METLPEESSSCVSAKKGKRQRVRNGAPVLAAVQPPPSAPPIPPGEFENVFPGETAARFTGYPPNERLVAIEVNGEKNYAWSRPGTRFSKNSIIPVIQDGSKWRVCGTYNSFGRRIDRPKMPRTEAAAVTGTASTAA